MTTKMTSKSTTTTMGYSIPLDLTFEILLRLPGKSVLRFKSVSKTWCSIISSQPFMDAFMSLSLSRPRLVLAFEGLNDGVLFFYLAHQNSSFLSSSLMLEKDSFTLPSANSHDIYNSVRGFICCRQGNQFMVCNLTTRQVIPLGENYYHDPCHMYLGYNPNKDQYKVLRLIFRKFFGSPIEHSVCNLGGQQSSNSWRPINTSIFYNGSHPRGGVCIDGVVYYEYNNRGQRVLSSFDVGSEELTLIETPSPEDYTGTLINYLGKLAVHCFLNNGFILWVLDDVKNKFWSKSMYIFQSFPDSMLSTFMGITASGEIVYVPKLFSDSCELFCCDVAKKMERRVRLEGLPKTHRAFPSDLCDLCSYVDSDLCSYVDNIVYL